MGVVARHEPRGGLGRIRFGTLFFVALLSVSAVRASSEPLVSLAPLDPDRLLRWSMAWLSLEQEADLAVDMKTAAEVEAEQDLRVDSLFVGLESASLGSRHVDPQTVSWVVERVLEGFVQADPRLAAILKRPAFARAAPEWDVEGRWTLPAALAALSGGNPVSAQAWLESGVWPSPDGPYLAVLGAETRMARGDTLGAAAWSEERLKAPGWPSWTEESLEEARISGALAEADWPRADSLLTSYGRRFAVGPWFLQTSVRLARAEGAVNLADSLSWVVTRKYPGSALAREWVADQVPLGSSVRTADPEELTVLLDAAEAQRGLTRFLKLAGVLRGHTTAEIARRTELRGGRLAYKTRRYEDLFNQHLSGRWPPPGGDLAEWGQILGRAYRNTGDPDSMAIWFQRSIDSARGERKADVFWEWGRELESHRKFAEAADVYDRLLRDAPGRRDNEVRLRRGLCRYQDGNIIGALSSFQSLVDPDTYDKSMAAFWNYRCQLSQNDLVRAREALERGAQERGYYAERSRVALSYADSLQIPLDQPDQFWAQVDGEADQPALQEITIRDDMRTARPWNPDNAGLPRGLNELAARLLLFRQYDRGPWVSRALGDLDRSADLGTKKGRLDRLYRLGFPDLAVRRALREGLSIGEYRFPAPFAAAVTAASARWGLTPEWVWSIMRRESLFENTVRSHAGAVGLMQFMQATADDVGAEFGLESRPLSSPEVNLQLGVAHLLQLRTEAPGKWPQILAGYNAGMHNAVRWIDPADDLDTYIEMIGYYETREYVKAVTAAYWIYRRDLRGSAMDAP